MKPSGLSNNESMQIQDFDGMQELISIRIIPEAAEPRVQTASERNDLSKVILRHCNSMCDRYSCICFNDSIENGTGNNKEICYNSPKTSYMLIIYIILQK